MIRITLGSIYLDGYSKMETQKGLFTKLGIFGAIAIALALGGKRHISMRKELRHKSDTDALVDSKQREFENSTLRPGVPLNDGETKYKRESKYVGAGSSYSSRKPGDRLSIMAYFGKD
mmetsp:Transcript_7925/g.7857  ORF Transcript_7925/g.7857 Transcript_7925/m.7857 type:complete len:118 (-) Transcript_7925:211-564(-)